MAANDYDFTDAIAWSMTHGQVMGAPRRPDGTLPTTCVHVPFTLKPYEYPKDAFDKAVALSTVFNTLTDRISRDHVWLLDVLHNTLDFDEFTRRLADIFKVVLQEGIIQQMYLGLLRSDYMIHSAPGDERNLLQVEINTIASSFGSLSTALTTMYRVLGGSDVAGHIPDNAARTELAAGLVSGHREFVEQYPMYAATAVIIMVVQPAERNYADQRLLHFEILEKHNEVKMVRATLKELHQYGSIDPETKCLLYAGTPASVVYFRAGYTPDDYPEPTCWDARLLVERSSAIKCPSIAYHLAGTKKVQQAIAMPGVLEHFLVRDGDDIEAASKNIELLRSVFAGLYSMDPKEQESFIPLHSAQSVAGAAPAPIAFVGQKRFPSLQALKTAVSVNPSKYVLKPQREGGGNNFYGDAIVKMLNTKSEEQLSAYILMERIMPTEQNAALVKDSTLVEASCICELGIFGVYMGSFSEVRVNKYAGYLLRVKPSSSDEGGVAAGFSCLSSPIFK